MDQTPRIVNRKTVNRTLRFVIRLVLFLPVVYLTSGCDGGSRSRIIVPIRPCIIRGSGWTKQSADEIDVRINALIRRVNFEVWIPTADIAFQPLLSGDNHYPIIDDPLPPGPANDPLHFGPSKLGDIEVDENRGATEEMDAARAACDSAWRSGGVNSESIVIVIARDLVHRGDSQAPSIGVNPGHLALLNRNERRDLCEVPRKLTKDDVHNQYAIIVDPELFSQPERRAQGDPAFTLAHELGHTLMLSHGDGLDNDENGTQPSANGPRRFDQDCDANEFMNIDERSSGPFSLMSGGFNNSLTNLQIELARTAAVLAPDALGAP